MYIYNLKNEKKETTFSLKMVFDYTSAFLTNIPHPYNKIGDGPEGPECAKVADNLNQGMKGKMLVSIKLEEKAKHERLNQVPLPRKITKVVSHGKKILFYLEKSPKDNEEIIIANELLMSGRWSKKKLKWTWFTFILETGEKFFFSESRPFGRTRVLFTSEQKDTYFSRLGPDLLKNVISKDEWITRFRTMTKRKRKNARPVLTCDALLEQNIFCGIGNYLRADIMYVAQIKPDKPVQELTDDELELLRVAAHTLIRKSYRSSGLTIRDYYDIDGSKGKYVTLVYNQKTDALGNPVIKSKFKGKHPTRTVHWVPSVQK